MSLFTHRTLLITGSTGSFGNAVLNRFLTTDIGEIRIFPTTPLQRLFWKESQLRFLTMVICTGILLI